MSITIEQHNKVMSYYGVGNKEISRIVIYDKDIKEPVLSINNGWIESQYIKEDKKAMEFRPKREKSITLPTDRVIARRKAIYDGKVFTLKNLLSAYERSYVLYIPSSMINFTFSKITETSLFYIFEYTAPHLDNNEREYVYSVYHSKTHLNTSDTDQINKLEQQSININTNVTLPDLEFESNINKLIELRKQHKKLHEKAHKQGKERILQVIESTNKKFGTNISL